MQVDPILLPILDTQNVTAPPVFGGGQRRSLRKHAPDRTASDVIDDLRSVIATTEITEVLVLLARKEKKRDRDDFLDTVVASLSGTQLEAHINISWASPKKLVIQPSVSWLCSFRC